MDAEVTESQQAVCARAGVSPDPPAVDSKVGLGPMGESPVNGLRHPVVGDTCGWYIWTGGAIDEHDSSFFRPLHLRHVVGAHPEVVPYLALPPGWRFQIAAGYEDIWFDGSILRIE
jgi:hypothetical protein